MINDVPDAIELRAEIECAFDKAAQPDINEIVYDSSSFQSEGQWLMGRTWQELTRVDLMRNHESIFFMTPKAFRYYLPAWLIPALDPEDADKVGDAITNCLAPPPVGVASSQEAFVSHISLFTPEQMHCVAMFFRYLDKYHHDQYYDDLPERALDRFWRNY